MEKTITTINKQNITIIDNGNEKLVPIKPICQALGIDFKSQYDKIKNDEIFNSMVVLSTTVANDEKQREMVCLPIKYVFGWLFTINPGNVNSDAKEAITKYKMECYEVLYRHFTARALAFERQNKEVMRLSALINEEQYVFATTRNRLNTLKKEFAELRDKDIEQVIIDIQSEIQFKD